MRVLGSTKKLTNVLPRNAGTFLDLACADLFERVGCLENKIDFVGRQLAQAQEIFACPARGHDPNVNCWDSETRELTLSVCWFRRSAETNFQLDSR